MDLKARVGKRLAELREARGISQHQLAKTVGLTSQFVGRLEGGERAPSLSVLAALAEALHVDPTELLRPDAPSAKLPLADLPLAAVQIQGALRRLGTEDTDLLLALTRRLGRTGR